MDPAEGSPTAEDASENNQAGHGHTKFKSMWVHSLTITHQLLLNYEASQHFMVSIVQWFRVESILLHYLRQTCERRDEQHFSAPHGVADAMIVGRALYEKHGRTDTMGGPTPTNPQPRRQ